MVTRHQAGATSGRLEASCRGRQSEYRSSSPPRKTQNGSALQSDLDVARVEGVVATSQGRSTWYTATWKLRWLPVPRRRTTRWDAQPTCTWRVALEVQLDSRHRELGDLSSQVAAVQADMQVLALVDAVAEQLAVRSAELDDLSAKLQVAQDEFGGGRVGEGRSRSATPGATIRWPSSKPTSTQPNPKLR